MASTRTRFTVSYVTLSMGAVIAFAVAMWSARKTVAQDQLVSQAQAFADRLLSDIRASKATVPLTVADTANPGAIKLSPQLRNYLDARPGYFILIGPRDQVLYNSVLIRMLAPTDGDSLLQYAKRLQRTEVAFVPLTADSTNEHKLAIRGRVAGPALQPEIDRLIVGIPDQVVDLSGQLLTGTMIVILP